MNSTTDEPQGYQDRQPLAAGQDEVENNDQRDNLQDADTPADLSDPTIDSASGGAMDNQTDGDRQLTTDSEAIDGGLNDSDLGADVAGLPSDQGTDTGPREGFAGLGPDTSSTSSGSTGDRATGVTDLRG